MPKTFGAALAVTTTLAGAAAAMPLQLPVRDAGVPIVAVANGCGPGFNRLITGECVPNRRVRVGPGQAVVLPPPCPRGYRRDPDPARPLCYPVF